MLRDASSTWGTASLPVPISPSLAALRASRRPASRGASLTLAAIGLAVSLAATSMAVSMTTHTPVDAVGSSPASAVAVVGAAPTAAADREPSPRRIVLDGPGDVAVVLVTYEAGQRSGWHAHAGLHAIAVVSVELTIYSDACTPLRVVPGQPYVGGQELHMARNETSQPVEMIVTYLNPATASGDPGPQAAPANCPVV